MRTERELRQDSDGRQQAPETQTPKEGFSRNHSVRGRAVTPRTREFIGSKKDSRSVPVLTEQGAITPSFQTCSHHVKLRLRGSAALPSTESLRLTEFRVAMRAQFGLEAPVTDRSK